MKNQLTLSVAVLLAAIVITGCIENSETVKKPSQDVTPAPATNTMQKTRNTSIPPQSEPEQVKPDLPVWKYGGVGVAGTYADAEIVDLGNGRYRMYYAVEPEVPGNKLEVFSAVSGDGMDWKKEDGVRREFSVFPDVVKLPDGRYRMYFQNQGVIKSAISSDGLSWTEEAGVRIDGTNTAGLKLENVAAPTTMKIGDEYVMVYRGTVNQKYPAEVPNSNMQLFLWAISKDGMVFEKKGIALDSRNSIFQGLLDGPELVRWDDGSIRLYFWSYRGIFHTVFKNGSFSQETGFDYTTASNLGMLFPPDPPCDPTLAKIGNKWFLYYGIHTKGINYATLEG
ncbi:MAG: hypothetical protein OIN66_17975 [Candidatus Methanoperedens sp.]|nr:hypothetical protein [Candidatus Methanoperedens sp.]